MKVKFLVASEPIIAVSRTTLSLEGNVEVGPAITLKFIKENMEQATTTIVETLLIIVKSGVLLQTQTKTGKHVDLL